MTAIYTRDESGILTRIVTYVDRSALDPITEIERLLGWPEREIEWHGNVGIGRDHGDTP